MKTEDRTIQTYLRIIPCSLCTFIYLCIVLSLFVSITTIIENLVLVITPFYKASIQTNLAGQNSKYPCIKDCIKSHDYFWSCIIYKNETNFMREISAGQYRHANSCHGIAWHLYYLRFCTKHSATFHILYITL